MPGDRLPLAGGRDCARVPVLRGQFYVDHGGHLRLVTEIGDRGRRARAGGDQLPGLAQLQAEGEARDEHPALAKAFCTVRMRETVGYARELLGGNGILLAYQVGRFVADAEAIYSYEGTREINTLVVGRAITGLSAFT